MRRGTRAGDAAALGRRLPWLERLVKSSEASACLSLCGNHASTLTPDAAGDMVECRVRCQDGFPLGPTLEFQVAEVFGDDAGRAIAFRPMHDPTRLIIAFRGVRVEREALKSQAAQPVRSRNRSRGSAVSDRGIDIKNMLGTQCASADWLPELGMRVHDGVMRHHDSFWTVRHENRQQRKSGAAAAAAAAAEEEEGGGERKTAYLGDWLPGQTGASEILFVGLSLGAALAQISALRAAAENPHLAPRIYVLALGTVQWADHATARHYRRIFEDRSAQLVNTARSAGPAPQHAGWWVPEPGSSSNSLEGAAGYVVVDPLTAELAPQFCLLHNVVPCRVPEPDSAELASLELALEPHIAEVTAQLGTLSALMRGTLNSAHPMSHDYQRLHLGRNYRSTLRDLFLRYGAGRQARPAAVSTDAGDVAPMSISPHVSPRCSPRLRAYSLPSSPRGLSPTSPTDSDGGAEQQLREPALTRSASLKRASPLPDLRLPPPAPKRLAGDGLRSIRSYPSRLSEAVGDAAPDGGEPVPSRVRSYASLEALAASAAAAVAELTPLWNKGREAVAQAVQHVNEIAMF